MCLGSVKVGSNAVPSGWLTLVDRVAAGVGSKRRFLTVDELLREAATGPPDGLPGQPVVPPRGCYFPPVCQGKDQGAPRVEPSAPYVIAEDRAGDNCLFLVRYGLGLFDACPQAQTCRDSAMRAGRRWINL